MNYIKRVLFFALIALTLLSLTSCLVEDDEYGGLENNGGGDKGKTENTVPKEDETEAAEASSMKPSVEKIDVIDEQFYGFVDLTIDKDDKIEDHPSKECIDRLVDNGYITSKINTSDEKGKFYPEQVLKNIEAITMLINAYSDKKINMNDWSADVCERIKEEGFPGVFVQKTSGDEAAVRRFLYDSMSFENAVILQTFCYERYTGNVLCDDKGEKDKTDNTFDTSVKYFHVVTQGSYGGFKANSLMTRASFAEILSSFLDLEGRE